MWAAQTTLLAPTVTLSPMVIGKKAMFPWHATDLEYTGFGTTILLQQMDFLSQACRTLDWIGTSDQCLLSTCINNVHYAWLLQDQCTKDHRTGHVHWLFHCFLNILIHQHSSMTIHFSCCIFLHISLLQNVSCHPCACQPCSHLVLLVWGSQDAIFADDHMFASGTNGSGATEATVHHQKRAIKSIKRGHQKESNLALPQKSLKVQTKYI